MQIRPSYLDTREAAKFTRLSKSYLEKIRIYEPEKSPPFIKIGRRILYSDAALHEWLDRKTVGASL